MRHLLAALGLLLLPAALSAQSLMRKDGRVFVYMTPNTMAVTYCQPISKDSVAVFSMLNMAYMDDSIQLEGIKVHEAVHRDQLMSDPSLCFTTFDRLLTMEVEAYCTEAHFLTRYGLKDEDVYWKQLAKLQFFFRGRLPYEQVTGALYAECGGMLHLGEKR